MANNFNYFTPTQNDTTGTPPANLFNRSTTPIPPAQPIYQQPQQSFFPQSQGNVFLINSSSELQNIPITNGMSAVICLSENILYLKTFQNNAPAILAYKLSSFEGPVAEAPREESQVQSLTSIISSMEERLKRLEDALPKKTGGIPEWQTQI